MVHINQFNTIRHCPGSDAVTGKILKQIMLKNAQPQIANVCCGTGEQALLLSKRFKKAHITAVDDDSLFFSSVMAKAKQAGVQDRIKTLRSEWEKLPFDLESLDLILSEGIFEELDLGKVLYRWRPYIKPGGYLAMSGLCLLKNEELPTELYDYLDTVYHNREIETIAYHTGQIQDAGYRLNTYLALPDDCWWEYYESMQKGMEILFGQTIEEEEQFYMTYKEYIGYVYFVARKMPLVSGDSTHAASLDKAQQLALRDHLIDKLSRKECNHTLRFTKYWLTDYIARENHEKILEGFREEGGYCDCEVLANVFHIIMEEEDDL